MRAKKYSKVRARACSSASWSVARRRFIAKSTANAPPRDAPPNVTAAPV
jgi:hypothetical protein